MSEAPESVRMDLRVRNLDCESEASAIRRGLADAPGVEEVRVNPGAARVTLLYDPAATSPEVLRERLAAIGFPALEARETSRAAPPWRNPKVLASLASGVLALAGWLLGRAGAVELSWGVLLFAIVAGGWYFGREALEELVHERRVGIELLMGVAAVAATAMGQPVEGATLVFLYSISEAMEGYTEQKTRSAIRALMDLAPRTARLRSDGREVDVPVESLVPGDVFVVRPGEGVATDGEVVSGTSGVDQAPVTGESVPVEKGPGEKVFAGSINGEGALEVRATKAYAENTISRIVQMVEDAHERKGRSERWIERFGHRYSPGVLLAGVVIAVLPPLVGAGGWHEWAARAIVFIVAAAPCALVISVPVTLAAALGTAARHGVLVKGGIFLEELSRVRIVALDKTGTLTRGEPEVTDFLTAAGEDAPGLLRREEFLAAAAGVERQSLHPLAKAVQRFAAAEGVAPAEVEEFRSHTGAGASATVAGSTVYVASPAYFEGRLGLAPGRWSADVERLQEDGKTVVLVGTGDAVWGLLALRDTLRPNARAAVAALRSAGIERVVMLTGDNDRAARAVARDVGIEEVYAGLSPEDKAVRVRGLAAEGGVAMVGDGVNDAPALAEASIGVAMGAAGTDVALETADVALMGDDLEKLGYALRLARRNRMIVRQNLILSVVIITTLAAGALTGVLTLTVTVLAHEISEFLVVANGLRMLRS